MDIDLTILMQFGIVLTLTALLNPLVFRPFQKILLEREQRTTVAQAEAQQNRQEARKDQETYEYRLTAAKEIGHRDREALREAGRDTERQLLAESRQQSSETLRLARGRILKSETAAQRALDGDTDALAGLIADKLLGRRVA